MSKINPDNTWIQESLYDNYTQSFKVKETICDTQTKFQHIQIIETESHGRVLFLDSVVQLTELDEHVYHEMITHIPLFEHPNPKRVLIIGGGDGGVLNRVLQHPSIEQVVLVEIDTDVIELSKKHLPKVSGKAFKDKRIIVTVADGDHYVATTNEFFDIIITDRGDDIGPGTILYATKFYTNCRRILTPKGILVAMTGVPGLQPQVLKKSFSLLKKIFTHNTCFRITVPTYIGGELAVTWSSKELTPNTTSIAKLEKKIGGLKTSYYNAEMHKSAFSLPNNIKKLL